MFTPVDTLEPYVKYTLTQTEQIERKKTIEKLKGMGQSVTQKIIENIYLSFAV